MPRKVAILVRRHAAVPRDVGDVNGRALVRQLDPSTFIPELVYLEGKRRSSQDAAVSLWRALFRRYDVIYASSPKRLYGILCLVFAILHARPLYFSVFDSTLEPFTASPLRRLVFRLLTTTRLVRPIAVSATQQRLFKEAFNFCVDIVGPCLLTFGYNACHPRLDPPMILFAGSTDNEKRGLDVLLRAVAMLTPRYPTLQVRILNKFTARQRTADATGTLIRALGISAHVSHAGMVSDMSSEYRRAWVYVLPFKRLKYVPPIPFTMLEAMSHSLCVITTTAPQFADLVSSGWMVEPGDHEALARKIDTILSERRTAEISADYYPEETARRFAALISRR